MSFAFNPPVIAYVILGAIVVVVVVAVLLKKKLEAWKKLLSIGAVAVVCVVFAVLVLRTSHVVVDGQGISSDGYGKHSISWTDVSRAVAVSDLASSPYAIGMRMGGISGLGDYKTGWFRLANGARALVTTTLTDRALVIEAGGGTYVFGPQDFDAFVAEVAKHVNVTREQGGAS